MALVTLQVAVATDAAGVVAAELIRLADILQARIRGTLPNGHVVYAEPGDTVSHVESVIRTALAHAS